LKAINVTDARAELATLIDDAQKEPVCLMKHGKPVAVLAGVEGADLGSVILESSQAFWDSLERARKGKRISIDEVRRRLTHHEPNTREQRRNRK
jgi:prevent-host-death family protein